MNIQEAKEELVRSVKAYTARDGDGELRIPASCQRPLLLMGPPGIGKTAVMEQAAGECGVGLLSYTLTHHTRQSAVGLPQLAKRTFGGREYTVTEYTMSEIIGAVYDYMERTGFREGILFLDEINCVSETLAPTMLQLLQFKTFGTHRVPEGWIIAAAGNPPEFNRSVRELDMAALDRVRTLRVEADFPVWRDYAGRRGVHPAVLSYLEMKPEHFYRVVQSREKREFVTARGWEDLSRTLKEYERQGFEADGTFVEEFLEHPEIAADFASYYRLYRTYMGLYRIPELLDGRLSEPEKKELLEKLRGAAGDVRCMVTRHLLAAAAARMERFGKGQRELDREREALEQLASFLKGDAQAGPETFLERRELALRVRKEHGVLSPPEERLERRTIRRLRELLGGPYREALRRELPAWDGESGTLPAAGLSEQEAKLLEEKQELCGFLERTTDFIEEAFGRDQELADWMEGLRQHGDFSLCGFERPETDGLSRQKRLEEQLRRRMAEMEERYEADDRI
ncbi:MAG: AAA family ATPase [Eubacteriales bacterium]|nr:AAA family ATPase [Eubacteriales bacterium]